MDVKWGSLHVQHESNLLTCLSPHFNHLIISGSLHNIHNCPIGEGCIRICLLRLRLETAAMNVLTDYLIIQSKTSLKEYPVFSDSTKWQIESKWKGFNERRKVSSRWQIRRGRQILCLLIPSGALLIKCPWLVW